MSFTGELLKEADPYLEVQMRTPFMQEMIEGTLAPERLRYWVRVDYPYLINFSKILALGVLRSPSLEAMRIVQRYLNFIVDEEMASHERFAESQGITLEELETQRMGPTKYAYAQHEFASANRGELPEILTAIMPCLVGWQILSKRILNNFSVAPDNPYKWWFDTYGRDAGLDGHVEALLSLVDSMAEALPESRLAELRQIFLTSEHYETVAWSAYYSMEEWTMPDSEASR